MMKNKPIKYLIYTIIAFTYSLVLSQIPEIFLRDRDSYLRYASIPESIFEKNIGNGFTSALFNEPLFLGLNWVLGLVLDPLFIPMLFSFIISFTLSFFFLKEIRGILFKTLGIFFLFFTPMLFHLQLVTLRQGFALSIFLITVMITKKQKIWILVAFILGFLHTSFFIFFILLYLEYLLRNLSIKTKILVYMIFSFFFSLSFLIVGSLMSVRQTEVYESVESSSSGLSFLLYASILILILSRGESYLKKYSYSSIAILGLVCYLSLYFISPIAGRLLSLFLPFIICTLFFTDKKLSYCYLIVYLILNLSTFERAIINNSLTEDFVSFSNF